MNSGQLPRGRAPADDPCGERRPMACCPSASVGSARREYPALEQLVLCSEAPRSRADAVGDHLEWHPFVDRLLRFLPSHDILRRHNDLRRVALAMWTPSETPSSVNCCMTCIVQHQLGGGAGLAQEVLDQVSRMHVLRFPVIRSLSDARQGHAVLDEKATHHGQVRCASRRERCPRHLQRHHRLWNASDLLTGSREEQVAKARADEVGPHRRRLRRHQDKRLDGDLQSQC
mmetsp:Transcript_36267/g.104310  ORF Transcript_36267/g.104310 Transcript_36267/m.104310 type:complete len:230 (-) Transcript_36267:824-1513(-)